MIKTIGMIVFVSNSFILCMLSITGAVKIEDLVVLEAMRGVLAVVVVGMPCDLEYL